MYLGHILGRAQHRFVSQRVRTVRDQVHGAKPPQASYDISKILTLPKGGWMASNETRRYQCQGESRACDVSIGPWRVRTTMIDTHDVQLDTKNLCVVVVVARGNETKIRKAQRRKRIVNSRAVVGSCGAVEQKTSFDDETLNAPTPTTQWPNGPHAANQHLRKNSRKVFTYQACARQTEEAKKREKPRHTKLSCLCICIGCWTLM